MTEIFRELCRLEVEADGVDFDTNSLTTTEIRAQDEYAGIRLKLKAVIGKAFVPLQVDVGFGDALSVTPEEITFPVLLGMDAPKLRAYSRETVVAEKLEALVELGMLNTRFKDYFDLHFLSQKFTFDGGILSKAISATFKRRGTPFPEGLPTGLTVAFSKDPSKMRGWESFCRKTVSKTKILPLDEVIRELVEFVGPPLVAASKEQKFQATWESKHWTSK